MRSSLFLPLPSTSLSYVRYIIHPFLFMTMISIFPLLSSRSIGPPVLTVLFLFGSCDHDDDEWGSSLPSFFVLPSFLLFESQMPRGSLTVSFHIPVIYSGLLLLFAPFFHFIRFFSSFDVARWRFPWSCHYSLCEWCFMMWTIIVTQASIIIFFFSVSLCLWWSVRRRKSFLSAIRGETSASINYDLEDDADDVSDDPSIIRWYNSKFWRVLRQPHPILSICCCGLLLCFACTTFIHPDPLISCDTIFLLFSVLLLPTLSDVSSSSSSSSMMLEHIMIWYPGITWNTISSHLFPSLFIHFILSSSPLLIFPHIIQSSHLDMWCDSVPASRTYSLFWNPSKNILILIQDRQEDWTADSGYEKRGRSTLRNWAIKMQQQINMWKNARRGWGGRWCRQSKTRTKFWYENHIHNFFVRNLYNRKHEDRNGESEENEGK